MLLAATLRIPDGRWVTIEPAAGDDPSPWADEPAASTDPGATAWDRCDRLWLGSRPFVRALPLTVFEAIDYGDVAFIPTLAEPARLPAGAGSTVLNLLATLAADQGRPALGYQGPYPGEELFLALLESFRYEPEGETEPLGAFGRRALVWRPAPYERLFAPDGTYVQLRGRVEKVVSGGRTYVRPDWQGVRRHAPRRVRDVEGGVVCSLWALDSAVADHIILGGDGEALRTLDTGGDRPRTYDTAAGVTGVRPLAPAVAEGIAAVVAAASAAPLAGAIVTESERMRFEWGPVVRDLVAVAGDDVRFSSALDALGVERTAAARTRADALELGLVALTELASLAGDTLRARAQARLLALPDAAQAAALSTMPHEGGTDARLIVRAVETLVEGWLGGSRLRPSR